jgi:CBS domain-containing protein
MGARDPIRDLVRGTPVSISEKLTLRSLAAVLSAIDIGVALVERDDGSVGIVSERDVTRALAEDADPDVVWSADIMTEDLVTAHPTELVMGVAMRLIDEGIRHVAVVDNETVVGIVSSRDVFRVLAEDLLDSW